MSQVLRNTFVTDLLRIPDDSILYAKVADIAYGQFFFYLPLPLCSLANIFPFKFLLIKGVLKSFWLRHSSERYWNSHDAQYICSVQFMAWNNKTNMKNAVLWKL